MRITLTLGARIDRNVQRVAILVTRCNAAALALTCLPELEAALPKSALLRFVPARLPTVDMSARKSEGATEMRGSLQRREARASTRHEDDDEVGWSVSDLSAHSLR